MRRWFLVLGAILLVEVCSPSAFAWHRSGHLTVALIAVKRIDDPAIRHQLVEILRQDPVIRADLDAPGGIPQGLDEAAREEFIIAWASYWPDYIRKNHKELGHDEWHYMNVPLYLSDKDKAELGGQVHPDLDEAYKPGTPEKDMNAEEAMGWAVQRLSQNATNSNEQVDQARALAWILHIVGDLHQPMHSSTLYGPGADLV